jgi:fructose-bisphosphate aldolase class I
MENKIIYDVAKKMMTRGKGILALDESNSTAGKRLQDIGVENTAENRRSYRNLFLSTENIEHYLSGVILFEETLNQKTNPGVLFSDHLNSLGILPGIKVDGGAKDHSDFPNEKITEGLDGLSERLKKYYEQGARFTKWRAVIQIDKEKGLPSKGSVVENAIRLAKYAKIVQEAGMVPVIEPEVILEGSHSISDAENVTQGTLSIVFEQIKEEGVDLKGLILKTSMVVPGSKSGEKMNPQDVAKRTVRVLQNSVPKDLAGVIFLSGGQTPEQARDNLNAIAKLEPLPWEIAFSYARAIQGPALRIWQGKKENVEKARDQFVNWLVFDTRADRGELDEEMEY